MKEQSSTAKRTIIAARRSSMAQCIKGRVSLRRAHDHPARSTLYGSTQHLG